MDKKSIIFEIMKAMFFPVIFELEIIKELKDTQFGKMYLQMIFILRIFTRITYVIMAILIGPKLIDLLMMIF